MSSVHNIKINNLNFNISISENNTIQFSCTEISTNNIIFTHTYHNNSTNSSIDYVRQDNHSEDSSQSNDSSIGAII